MTEWMESAWMGWKNYITDGKLAAVFLLALLFLWFCQKKVEQKPFLLYTTVMTLCCLIPVTAAMLMIYQTRFYDYEWIWSMVPVTAVTAWGIVVLLWQVWPDLGFRRRRKGLPPALLILAGILLCGSMGGEIRESGCEGKEESRQARAVLELAKEEYSGEELCLWAPREIMGYVREADPKVRLPYGRDMWDSSLQGFSYDIYDEGTRAMYHWMEAVSAGEDLSRKEGETEGGELWEEDPAKLCAGYAAEAGVNCILIPDRAAPETIEAMKKALRVEARKLEGYWIFYGWAD